MSEIKRFETDDPHLKGIYNAVNNIVASQKIMVDLIHNELPELENTKALAGNNHSEIAHQAAREMGDTSRLANKVLAHLQWALDIALTKSHRRQAGDDNPVWEGWVSRDELSLVVGGGDGARRARELRENGYPVESKMMKIGDRPKQAYYRLLEDEESDVELCQGYNQLHHEREHRQYRDEGLL